MTIFDSRNPFAILIVLISIISLSTVFWGYGYRVINGHTLEELQKNKELWSKREPLNYSYTIFDGCMFVRKSEVMVLFGKVHIKEGDEAGGSTRSNIVINQLFSFAEEGLIAADGFDISYDETYGYPQTIKLDWDEDTIDDECFYSVGKFELHE